MWFALNSFDLKFSKTERIMKEKSRIVCTIQLSFGFGFLRTCRNLLKIKVLIIFLDTKWDQEISQQY